MARFGVPAGPVRLQLRAPGLAETVALDAAPGSLTFVLVRAFPGFRRIDVKTFQTGSEDAPAPAEALPVNLPVAPPAGLQ